MSTIGEIATWAYGKINRPDLALTAVQEVANVYLLVCSKVPFDELKRTTSELPLTVNAPSLDLEAVEDVLIPNVSINKTIMAILSIRCCYGVNQYRRLRRSDTRVLDAMSSYPPGRPATYSRFAGQLWFNPIPNLSTYTIRIRFWMRPKVPVSPNEMSDYVLLTPTEWDELMKWETLYRLYIHTEQHDKAASLMQVTPLPRQPSPYKTRTFEMGIIPRLWNDLLLTVNQRENGDEDFSINPLARRYTRG